MGGRGSSSKGKSENKPLSDNDYSLLEYSKYGDELSSTNDSSAYSYGSKYGLNNNEVNLIHSYTVDLFSKLNDDIRNGEAGITDFTKNKLNTALEKLPSYNGVAYRGINVKNPGEFANNLKNTGRFKFDSFTSTSTDRNVVSQFSKKNSGVIFKIKSKSGKHIRNFSTEKKENEVLFSAGSKFKYKKHYSKDGYTIIEISEI
jgi:hypothetical protein